MVGQTDKELQRARFPVDFISNPDDRQPGNLLLSAAQVFNNSRRRPPLPSRRRDVLSIVFEGQPLNKQFGVIGEFAKCFTSGDRLAFVHAKVSYDQRYVVVVFVFCSGLIRQRSRLPPKRRRSHDLPSEAQFIVRVGVFFRCHHLQFAEQTSFAHDLLDLIVRQPVQFQGLALCAVQRLKFVAFVLPFKQSDFWNGARTGRLGQSCNFATFHIQITNCL